MSKFQSNKRGLLKEKCLHYLSGKKCKHCEVDYLPMGCYDFHHEKGAKEENISILINKNIKFTKLKKELDKCIVLCKNCHALIHSTH